MNGYRVLRRVWRTLAAALFAGIAAVLSPACTLLPGTGQSGLPTVSRQEPSDPPAVSTEKRSTGALHGTATVNASGSGGQAPHSAQPASGVTKTASPPMLRLGSRGNDVVQLQQNLAKLGYLPVRWSSTAGGAGSWQWRWPASQVPANLKVLWAPGVYNVLTEGAVMAFQAANGLQADGVVGPKTRAALTHAVATGRTNPWGYTWIWVRESRPESVTVWHNGATVLTSPANTGISASPTVIATYPVYVQYRSQTMQGVTPWGQHYYDPGVPYVSYFYRGDAVHGFMRRAYGYPQSLGCVELPVEKAAKAWPYIHIGTLVTVTPPGRS
jgi:peptidoglycan hydrolase-like protein with peptidoglycan-binding domain